MITLLKNWKGAVEINGIHYENAQAAVSGFKPTTGDVHIILKSAVKQPDTQVITQVGGKLGELRITVKSYMTKPSTPEFDFMNKWNNNVPMPMCTMQGTVEKETRGMVYMKLHGQAEPVIRCMRCGRPLTNPISQQYGIGPECITKIPMLMKLDINDVEEIKKQMVQVTWEGWIIKSAITEQEEV